MNKSASQENKTQQDLERLQQFRFLLDFSDTPVAIYNLSGKHFFDANEAACRLMKLGRDSIRSASADDIITYLNVEFPPGIPDLESAVKHKGPIQVRFTDDHNNLRSYNVNAKHAIFQDATYVVLTVHDITDLLNLQNTSLFTQQREQKQRDMLAQLANNPVYLQGGIEDIFKHTIEAIKTVLQPTYIDTWVRRRVNNTSFTPVRGSNTEELSTRIPQVQELLRALNNHSAIHISDANSNPLTAELIETLWPTRAGFTAVFYPIHTAGILGSIIAVWRPTEKSWHQDEISFISNVGEYIGQGLRNFLGRRTVNDAASMSGMVINMLSTANIDTAFEEIARTAEKVIGASSIAIFTREETSEDDRYHVVGHKLEESIMLNLKKNLGACIEHPDITSTLLQGKPLMIYRETQPPASEFNNPILQPDFHQAMIMPMVYEEKLRGGIVVLYQNPRRFMVGEINLLETLAQQSISALEITRMVFELKEQQSHLNLLFELNRLNSRSLDRTEIAENALLAINQAFGSTTAILVVQEPESGDMNVLATIGLSEDRRNFLARHSKPNVGLAGTTIAQRRTIIINDIAHSKEWADIFTPSASGSMISVPIFIGQNAVASISLAHPDVGHFTEKHELLIKSAGSTLSTALAYAQLIANEHAKLQAERSAIVFTNSAQQALDVLTVDLNVDKVLDRVLDAVAGVLDAATYNIILIEDDHGRIVRSRGYDKIHLDPDRLANATVPVFEFDNFKRMIRTGDPVIIDNTATDPHWVSSDSSRQGRAYIGVAIRIGDETVGFINANGFTPGQFKIDDARKLSIFAGYVALALRNARTFQRASSYAADLEQRVTSRTKELQLRAKWAEAMINSTSDGIIVLDDQFNRIQLNHVATRLFTQTLSHMDLRILNTALDELVRAKLPKETQVNLNGLELELKASNIEDETDPAIIVTIHDITHLRAIDRMRSQFVSDISHELRTPIATIGLYADLLRKHIDDQQVGYLDALNEELTALTRMVESILLVSRYETNRDVLTPQPVNLNIITSGAADSFEILAQAKGLKFSRKLADYPVVAYVDMSAFKHVLNNIIENAITYTDTGEVTISTAMRKINRREWAVLSVKDTGIGISSHEQEHIFDRFYRGEVTRQRQIAGGGMGLALAQIITRQHGGHITVTSEVGQGSEFHIYLPTAQP